jgi:hypothetical protein
MVIGRGSPSIAPGTTAFHADIEFLSGDATGSRDRDRAGMTCKQFIGARPDQFFDVGLRVRLRRFLAGFTKNLRQDRVLICNAAAREQQGRAGDERHSKLHGSQSSKHCGGIFGAR